MVVNDYFYLHHLLGEWSKMLLTTIHYEGEILRLPSARLLIAYEGNGDERDFYEDIVEPIVLSRLESMGITAEALYGGLGR